MVSGSARRTRLTASQTVWKSQFLHYVIWHDVDQQQIMYLSFTWWLLVSGSKKIKAATSLASLSGFRKDQTGWSCTETQVTLENVAMKWMLEDGRTKRWPPKTRHATFSEDLQDASVRWREAKTAATNHQQWRNLVAGVPTATGGTK